MWNICDSDSRKLIHIYLIIDCVINDDFFALSRLFNEFLSWLLCDFHLLLLEHTKTLFSVTVLTLGERVICLNKTVLPTWFENWAESPQRADRKSAICQDCSKLKRGLVLSHVKNGKSDFINPTRLAFFSLPSPFNRFRKSLEKWTLLSFSVTDA